MKRKLDQFDMEAEREGNAITQSHELNCRPFVGKRIRRERQSMTRGNVIQNNRAVKKYLV